MIEKFGSELSTIDPKKLIQQDGLFVGAIADIKLAQIGAYAENEARDSDLNSERIEIAGNRAILQEIQNRARKLVAMYVHLSEPISTVLSDFNDEKELKLSQRN